MRFHICFLVFTAALLACACTPPKEVKTDQTTSFADEGRELPPEEESKIKLIINFDGKWQKASTVILISGKTGKIIGKNGGEIDVTVRYLSEKKIKIIEGEYNPLYLENWFPPEIARKAVNNPNLKAFSILEIVDADTLKGYAYAWKIVHQSNVIMSVEPFKSYETWKRIK